MTKKNNYKRKRSTRKNSNFKKKRTLKKHYKQNIKIRGGVSNVHDDNSDLQHIQNSDEQSSDQDASHCDNVNELNELITKYTTASNASLTFPQLPTNESHEIVFKMKQEIDKISGCIQENTEYLERNKDQLLQIFKNATNAGLTEIVQKMVDSLITISYFKENFKLHAETDMSQRNIYKEAEDSMNASNEKIRSYYKRKAQNSMNASNEKILSYYEELQEIIRILDNII